jgi:hypothetical protein
LSSLFGGTLVALVAVTLLTRQTPRDMADERERIQEMLDLHRQFSEQAQQNMSSYVQKLESRVSALPKEIEAGIDSRQIAKMLGARLQQNFLQSGLSDTIKGLQATGAVMSSAQKELSTTLREVSDSRLGVVAQVESANNRLANSLERCAKTLDALLNEVKSDLLHVWIPLIAGGALLIGLFSGLGIQNWRDSASKSVVFSTPISSNKCVAAPESNPFEKYRIARNRAGH